MDSDAQSKNLREFYLRDGRRLPAGKMRGEMPDVVRAAVKYGAVMGFDLSLARKKVWGVPVDFNDFTGRITVKIGTDGHSPYTTSFLIRHVKQFDFAWELWEEYRRNEKP